MEEKSNEEQEEEKKGKHKESIVFACICSYAWGPCEALCALLSLLGFSGACGTGASDRGIVSKRHLARTWRLRLAQKFGSEIWLRVHSPKHSVVELFVNP